MAHLEPVSPRNSAQSRLILLRKLEVSLPWLLALIGVGWWEIGVQIDYISPLFFPAPSLIIVTLWDLFQSGQLQENVMATMWRLSLGVLSGGSLGLFLGALMGWSARWRAMLNPVVAVLHPIPKISLFPLIIIFFGIGDTSKIVLIALGAFFPMLLNTLAGVQQLNPIYFDVAQVYQATPLTVWRRIILPGSLPLILVGTRLAINNGLVFTVAVELVAANQGLGAAIWLAWETLRTEYLYANLLVIAALGLLFNGLLEQLTRWAVPWRTN